MLKEERLYNQIEKLQIELEKISKPYYKKLSKKRLELKDSYTHSKTKEVLQTIPGSYLDKREYHKKTVCVFCDKQLKDDITYGSYD